VLAVELDELAGHRELGEVLEEKTAFAPAAEREFADQLLVSGLLAGRGGDPGEQLAIGHMPRLRQVESLVTSGGQGLHRNRGLAVEWGIRVVLAEPEDRFDRFPAAQEMAAASARTASGFTFFGCEPLALPWHPQSSADRKGRNP
jgi:hypothetical protein